MRKLKRISFLGLVALLFMVLVACGSDEELDAGDADTGGEDAADDEVIKIKVGHIAAPDEPYSVGFDAYVDAVEEATDNRVEFEVFGHGELGGEGDVVEQMQLGSVDMSLITTGVLGDFHEDLTVLDLPFLFRDADHAHTVLDSDFAMDLLDGMNEEGFKGIAFWENGVRHVSNSKHPIEKVEDLSGVKMRTIENNIFIESYKALGAEPVPMAFPEVYSSLQQGVIDGTDQPYSIFWNHKIFEVQEFYTELGLYYASATLLMNDDFYESLPEDIQEIIVDLGQEYAGIQRQIAQEYDEEIKADLLEEGHNIVPAEDIDRSEFEDAVQPVYDGLDDDFKEYVELIRGM